MPILSVIMPVFNADKYLQEAINSIINQSFTNWELIVINDGSVDSGESIINSYTDTRIKYYKNEQNIGLIKTLNKGIDLCTGKYIARMDADDVSEKDRFKLQIAFLEKNTDHALCGTNAKVIDESNSETGKILNLETNDYLQVNLLFSVPFIHPSMMIRSDVLKNNRFDEKYKHAEDYELWCRIAGKHKVANIENFLLRYRWHTQNVSVAHAEKQEEIKSTIICNELEKIGLVASEEELQLHKVTFKQFDSKATLIKQAFKDYTKLDIWFQKIIKANRERKRYNEAALISFLWSRWIVLCISQKNYRKIFKAGFTSYKLPVLFRTLQLIWFLRKKA